MGIQMAKCYFGGGNLRTDEMSSPVKVHPLRQHTVNEVRLGPCSVPEASNHGKACVRVNKLSQSVHRVKVGNYHLEVDRGVFI